MTPCTPTPTLLRDTIGQLMIMEIAANGYYPN
jgi:hypothetical protein